jgi:hypothetical protein
MVRGLTADPEAALHVSIAGGRKTMGFFAAYALSIFGRPQDRLSHVLVQPPFESHPGFFYPTRRTRVIYSPPPESRPLDTATAVVTLADIPFIRLRDGLPARLIEGASTFGETVVAAERALAPVTLAIDLAAQAIVVGDAMLPLAPAPLAFLAWLAERRLAGEGPVAIPPEEGGDPRYAAAFLALYRTIRRGGDDERTARALARGMDKGFFLSTKSRLIRDLRAGLGPLAAQIVPRATGRRPATGFFLPLPPERIRFAADGKLAALAAAPDTPEDGLP